MKIDISTGKTISEPTKNTAPTFGDDMTKSQLKEAIREYSVWVIEHYDLEISLAGVPIQVSSQMKRTAGKVINKRNDPDDHRIRYAYRAYQTWGWEGEFEATIRHELVHVWELQQFGKAGHGARFKGKARELDAPRHCQKFSDHKYEVFCTECEKIVAKRHKRSKTVKSPESYRSKCCQEKCGSRSV